MLRTIVNVGVLLQLLIACAQSQMLSMGSCPAVNPMSNFNVEAYLGRWYEIEKYNTLFQMGGRCTTATYGATSDPKTISVVNRQVGITGRVSSISGTASAVGDPSVARLQVVFPVSAFASIFAGNSGNYWVLDTDYKQFAIVYSCREFWGFQAEFLWVLARTNVISDNLQKEIRQKIKNFGIDTNRLSLTDHVYCNDQNPDIIS